MHHPHAVLGIREALPQTLSALEVLSILIVGLFEFELADFLSDPVPKLEKLLAFLLHALFIQPPVVQLHHRLKVLVVHLVAEEAHLEKFESWLLSYCYIR